MEHIIHSIEPVFDAESRVLILGTMPSPKSREVQFYYGHPAEPVLAGSGGGAGGRGAPVCPGKEGHAAAAPDRPVGRAGRM